MRTVKPLRFTDYESRGYPPDRKSLGILLALFLVLIWNGIHAHSRDVLLVAGEGFEPSKAEPGDLQSPPIGRSGNPPGLSFEAARVDYPILMEANNRVKMASSKSDYFPATSFTKA